MNMEKVNDALQLLASIGVLVGLFVVAYELRQNTVFAEAEYNETTYGMWMQATAMEMETDIGEIYIKSIEDPDNLSKPEKFKLNSWLTHIISIYDHGDSSSELGVGTALSGAMLEADLRYYFDSDYARLWFQSNRYWIRPRVAESISKVIDSFPVHKEWIPVRNYSEPSTFEQTRIANVCFWPKAASRFPRISMI